MEWAQPEPLVTRLQRKFIVDLSPDGAYAGLWVMTKDDPQLEVFSILALDELEQFSIMIQYALANAKNNQRQKENQHDTLA